MFDNRVLLITGGTGSFGSTVLNRFIHEPFKEIRIFSRDEKKQEDQRLHYRDPRLRYYIGDVRDLRSIAGAVKDVDYIFHAAALKQVPSCEFHPMEAVKTNIIGTDNLRITRRVPVD
jgi:UDP-N-acetylglucosamine 4,6-dehydratase